MRLRTHGGPAAVKTRLGWTLQGPTRYSKQQATSQECLHVSTLSPTAEILLSVERLWQLDVLPYRREKLVTRSRQDQEAVRLLEAKTTQVKVDGIQRYATPLHRVKNMPQLQAPKEAVLANLGTCACCETLKEQQYTVHRLESWKRQAMQLKCQKRS